MVDYENIARDLFARYGLDPGTRTPEPNEMHYEFTAGGECHVVFFEFGRVHFHVGYGAWNGCVPRGAPDIRLRHMEHLGHDVAESDWFVC
jgi:hypothetical protein